MKNKDASFEHNAPLIFSNYVHGALIEYCRTNGIDERPVLAKHDEYLEDELLKWAESTGNELYYLDARRKHGCAKNVLASRAFDQIKHQAEIILLTSQLVNDYKDSLTAVSFFVFDLPPYISDSMRNIAAINEVRAYIICLVAYGRLEPAIGGALLALGLEQQANLDAEHIKMQTGNTL